MNGISADGQTEIRAEERVIEIAPERLREFVAHPFHVNEDPEMEKLMESIKLYGILLLSGSSKESG